MRKEKQSFETNLAAEISKREEELNTVWQDKIEKAVSSTESRWKVKYSGLEDEFQTLQTRLEEAQRGALLICTRQLSYFSNAYVL